MPDNSTIYFLDNSTLTYLVPFRKRHYYTYTFILLLIITAITALPFVSTSLSVNTQGVTRPASERTEVKNITAGIIEKINYKEGDTIAKGAVLLRIKDEVSHGKRLMNNFEIEQRVNFIHYFTLLTVSEQNESLLSQLNTTLYKLQQSKQPATANVYNLYVCPQDMKQGNNSIGQLTMLSKTGTKFLNNKKFRHDKHNFGFTKNGIGFTFRI